MTSQQHPDLAQLAETVARLSEALSASERRHAAIARTMRWTALALVTLIGAGIYAGSDWMKVYAAQRIFASSGVLNEMEQAMANSPPGLDKVLPSLMGLDKIDGALVKVLQSAGMIAMVETQSAADCIRERDASGDADKLCYASALVQDLGEYYLLPDGSQIKPPAQGASQQEQMAYAQQMMQATLMAAGQAVVDGATLMHRLRRSSDVLRGIFAEQGIGKNLSDVRQEIANLNALLASVPVMAAQMDAMNRNMASMSYSMGSTMGRMGNIMPW